VNAVEGPNTALLTTAILGHPRSQVNARQGQKTERFETALALPPGCRARCGPLGLSGARPLFLLIPLRAATARETLAETVISDVDCGQTAVTAEKGKCWRCSMKPALTLLVLLLASTLSFAQDVRLRQEAVGLLENANRVSLSPNLPNLERTVTFRVLDSASGPQEGTFTRVVVQGTGRRDEFTFGDYHVINVYTRERLATTRTRELAPPQVVNVQRLTPIYLLLFDHEDVIYAINNSQVNGRPARCIQFNTIGGQKNDQNELCVDAVNGTLVSERVGNEYIENSDFFSFAGALFPGKISYSVSGIPRLEISQAMTELTDATPNVLAAPPNAQIRTLCTSFRRAFGEFMPQPKPGKGGEDVDLVLRGIIGRDGKVHDAVVQSSDRPDLDEEALGLIRQWTFTPAMCNGKPATTEANFTLHFQAR
jgi:TonB family protein